MYYVLVRVRHGWRIWQLHTREAEALDEAYHLRMTGATARVVRAGKPTPPRLRLVT